MSDTKWDPVDLIFPKSFDDFCESLEHLMRAKADLVRALEIIQGSSSGEADTCI